MVHITLFFSSLLSFDSKRRRGFLFLSFFLLFVFSALRYNFGNDYTSYQRWFEYIKIGGKSPYGSQIGFTWLNRIIPSYYLLLAIISFLFLWSVYHMIKANLDAELYGLAVFIFTINPYLFLMNLSAIRQSIAIALFIIAVNCAQKKQLVRYIILIAVAGLFHTSAIVLFPFYFIINENKINKFFVAIIAGLLILTFADEKFFNNTIQSILNFFDNSQYEHYYSDVQGNSLRATLLSSIYLIYVLLNINRLSGKKLLFSKLYLISLILAIFEFRLSMLTRIQMYFDIFSIISLPSIFTHCYKNSRGTADKIFNVIIFPTLIVIIYFLRYYSFFTNPLWESFRTYHSILELL